MHTHNILQHIATMHAYIHMQVCMHTHTCMLPYIGKFSRHKIFEDGLLVTIDYNGTSAFRVVKISRLQANPQKQ